MAADPILIIAADSTAKAIPGAPHTHGQLSRFIVAKDNPTSLVLAARTAVAAVVSYLIARLFHLPEAYWAPISTVIGMGSTLGAALPDRQSGRDGLQPRAVHAVVHGGEDAHAWRDDRGQPGEQVAHVLLRHRADVHLQRDDQRQQGRLGRLPLEAAKRERADADGERGDEIVEITVTVPMPRDERTKELLRELAKLNPEDPREELWKKV